MQTFDILSPESSEFYPMTILWIEDRLGQEVRKGETIALLRTPVGDRQLLSAASGRISVVQRRKGDTLPNRDTLITVQETGHGVEPSPNGNRIPATAVPTQSKGRVRRAVWNLMAGHLAPVAVGIITAFILIQIGPDLYRKAVAFAMTALTATSR